MEKINKKDCKQIVEKLGIPNKISIIKQYEIEIQRVIEEKTNMRWYKYNDCNIFYDVMCISSQENKSYNNMVQLLADYIYSVVNKKAFSKDLLEIIKKNAIASKISNC